MYWRWPFCSSLDPSWVHNWCCFPEASFNVIYWEPLPARHPRFSIDYEFFDLLSDMAWIQQNLQVISRNHAWIEFASNRNTCARHFIKSDWFYPLHWQMSYTLTYLDRLFRLLTLSSRFYHFKWSNRSTRRAKKTKVETQRNDIWGTRPHKWKEWNSGPKSSKNY